MSTPHGNLCVNARLGALALKPVVERLLQFLAKEASDIMGTKIRDFAPLPDLSLEELVSKDNFYRRLDLIVCLATSPYCGLRRKGLGKTDLPKSKTWWFAALSGVRSARLEPATF